MSFAGTATGVANKNVIVLDGAGNSIISFSSIGLTAQSFKAKRSIYVSDSSVAQQFAIHASTDTDSSAASSAAVPSYTVNYATAQNIVWRVLTGTDDSAQFMRRAIWIEYK